MLILRGTTDKLQIVTGSAGTITRDFDVMKASAASPPVIQVFPDFGAGANIVTATTTDVVDATSLSAGEVYNVVGGRIYNAHASNSNTVTVQKTDGTNTAVVAKVSLLAGESLTLNEMGEWVHRDSNGGDYPAVVAGPGVAAGGTAGQVLTKVDGTNYNTTWSNVESINSFMLMGG